MKQIRLTKGLYALVSDDDFEYLSQWRWQASNESRGTKWYAVRFVNVPGRGRVKLRMHRVIFARMLQESTGTTIVLGFPRVVDHVNHNSLDNRRENIRVITQRENMLASPGWKRKK